MSMKKQSQSSFAYISNMFDYPEQPNIQQNDQPQTISKTSTYVSKDKMFCEMMNEMDGSMTSYLNKLVSKNEREEEKKKSVQKIHERTKSNTDIFATSPLNTKGTLEKGPSQRITHQSSPSQISNIFSSVNITPTNQKSQKVQIQDDRKCDEFLGMLDSYLFDLSQKKVRKEMGKQTIEECKPERKTVQKSRQNNLYNLQFIHKIEAAVENQAQLRKENAYLMQETRKLSLEMNKIKRQCGETGKNLIKNAKYLEQELQKQKQSRRKLEQFLNHLNEKFSMLRPQRKTLGAMSSRFHEYMNSQTTEQDDEDFYSTQQFNFRNKNQQKRNSNKSTSKLHRNQHFNTNIQSFSRMFGEIDFGEGYYDEEKESVCYDM